MELKRQLDAKYDTLCMLKNKQLQAMSESEGSQPTSSIIQLDHVSVVVNGAGCCGKDSVSGSYLEQGGESHQDVNDGGYGLKP